MSKRTLSKKLASVKPGSLFVGVDQGLDRNVALVLTERGQPLTQFGFPNERGGYDYLYRRVDALQEHAQAPQVWVGMEPTSYFWQLLAADIERHRPHYHYRLVNAYTVKKHREGDQLDRSKDDPRDAFTIADLLRSGKFTETRLLHGGYAELRQHVTLYDRLQGDVRRQKTIVHCMASQLFPELGSAFKDFSCQTALAMLRGHAAAAKLQTMSQPAFIAAVRRTFDGQRLSVSKLRLAHARAQGSVGLREGVAGLQLALRAHIETLALLRQQVAEAQSDLLAVFQALPEAPYLLSVHGLGAITAATILAEIGDPSNYTSASQLVKLAGTQPVANTSGRKTHSQTPMSGQGRARLRTALFFAVMRLVQVDPAFARDYQHLQTRVQNPLKKMQALGVLMNKLLRILWALMRTRTHYNPDFQRAA